MRIHIRYFASVRDAIGRGEEHLDLPGGAMSVTALRAHLAERVDSRAIAGCRNVRCAVNQVMVGEAAVVGDGDEVAFFPPVTGG